ncbi:MAG: glycosyltransferase family 4 protein [Candidatus Omnitrophica bacterium]|nr:glycosyltransferase family 4 protein [Candidatus Omnitrophota bacterium]
MRIGIDCRALQNTSRTMGIGTYSRNLIRALQANDGSHHWIPFGFDRRPCLPAGRPASPGGLDPLFEQWIDRDGFRVTHAQSLRSGLQHRKIDLCHLLEFGPPFATAGRTIATAYDLIPLIFQKIYMRWRYPRARWNIERHYRFLGQVRHIVATSEYTRMDLVRILRIPEEKITVIYPGLHPVFRPSEDRRGIDAVLARHEIRRPFVLYVGSCDWRKNITGLLSAFARFRRDGFKNFQLVLAGAQAQFWKGKLSQQAASLGIDGALRLTGFVSEEDLVALYNAASMLVYPSFYEGFGFPPLEAMACGTPVVTSNNSSLKEVAADGAALVDPSDTRAIVEAMRRIVLDASFSQALIQRGMAQARRFCWHGTARQTLHLYESII